jgi:hypothetical protein
VQVEAPIDLPPVACTICGSELNGGPDEQPDWPSGPLCGNCYQAREMDNELWWSDQMGDD